MRIGPVIAIVMLVGGAILAGIYSAALRAPPRFIPETVDFGRLWAGDQVVREVVIKNESDKPIDLSSLDPECDCTVLDTSRPIIAPGENAKINVRFTAPNQRGKLSRKVEIKAGTDQASLTLKADIRLRYEVTPESLVLPELSPGEEFKTNIHFVNFTEDAFNIQPFQAPDGLQVELRSRSASNMSFSLVITADAMVLEQWLNEPLTFVTSFAQHPQVRIPITGRRESSLIVTPMPINLGVITKQKDAVATAKLRHSALGSSFQLMEVVLPRFVKFHAVKILAPGEYQVDFFVHLEAGNTNSLLEDFVTFVTNDPQRSRYDARIFGAVVMSAHAEGDCCGPQEQKVEQAINE